MSTGIKMILSINTLLLVMLLTGLWPKLAFLLLPFGLICLFVLSLGMGMLMATFMVFFRDTQFLWGVMSMLWMYATPIFYPESIIPEKLMLFYKMNPLYHIIRFCRSVLIDGISPEPKAYLLCLIACFVPLVLGLLVFRRQQDKFVLYI
jgi:ABC-2 type transport system permease protein